MGPEKPNPETPLQPVAPEPVYTCSKNRGSDSFLQVSAEKILRHDQIDTQQRSEEIDLSNRLPSSFHTGMRFSESGTSMSMKKGKGGSNEKKEKSGLGKLVDKGVNAAKTAAKKAVKKALSSAKCAVGKKLPFGLGKKLTASHCPKPKPKRKPKTKKKPAPPTPKPKPPPKPKSPVSPIKQTWADVEACEACKFIWDSIGLELASYDYDSVASAFEDKCNDQPEIFAAPCEEMRKQLAHMIDDFLIFKATTPVCVCAGMGPCDKVN